MNESEAIDYILRDKVCLDIIKKLSPLDLLNALNNLGIIKSKQDARDIIVKINEHVWMEPVKIHQFPPDPKKRPNDWPYDGQNVQFMKRKRTARQGLTM